MTRARRRVLLVLLGIGFVVGAVLIGVPWVRVALDDRAGSRSVGSVSEGRLEHGHVFAPWGAGYRTYSFVGAMLGSQYAHGAMRDAVTAAFGARGRAGAATYVLGEASARQGGPHHGHLSHRNGLSIDIFMPVRDPAGARATLPTWPWQLLGYGWEFDPDGKNASYRIDFDELGALLVAIEEQANERRLEILRVIIAPEYVAPLLASREQGRLRTLADKLTRRTVAVRHDEHVHIDFRVRE